jgi:hypothetical protein
LALGWGCQARARRLRPLLAQKLFMLVAPFSKHQPHNTSLGICCPGVHAHARTQALPQTRFCHGRALCCSHSTPPPAPFTPPPPLYTTTFAVASPPPPFSPRPTHPPTPRCARPPSHQQASGFSSPTPASRLAGTGLSFYWSSTAACWCQCRYPSLARTLHARPPCLATTL